MTHVTEQRRSIPSLAWALLRLGSVAFGGLGAAMALSSANSWSGAAGWSRAISAMPTVVIGGFVTSTILTLLILPTLY